MLELEQRLATVEHELHQLKASARVPSHQQPQAQYPNPTVQHGAYQPSMPQTNEQAHLTHSQRLAPNIQGSSGIGNPPIPPMQPNQSGQQSVQPGSHAQAFPPIHAPAGNPTIPNAQAHAYGQSMPHMQGNVGRQQVPPMQPNVGVQYQPSSTPYPQQSKQEGRSVENILVRYVLPIVFVIILLIGILMLFIAGVAFGLITEPVRCLLGVLLAAALYTTGLLQHQRSKRPILGKALLGGAHGVLIITISIAHLSYELFGVFIAAAFYALSCGLIIFSAIRWRSQLLVCIAIISAYLCMYLIDIQQIHAIPYLLVQLVISISLMLLSSALQYRYAHSIAYFLLHFSLIITSSIHLEAANGFLIAALLAQHLVVFIQYMKRKVIPIELHLMQASGVVAIISWTAYVYDGKSIIFLILSLLVAFAYAVAILFFERREQDEDDELVQRSPLKARIEVSALMAAFSLLCFFINLLGNHYINLIMYVVGVSLVLYGLRDKHQLLRWSGAALLAIGTVSIMLDPMRSLLSYEMLCWVVLLASFPVLYRECKQTFQQEQINSSNVAVWLSTILWIEAALAFWFITLVGNLIGELIGASDAQPYFVSFAWLLYAIAAITYGTIRQNAKARLTGIILLLAIAFKVVFIDITFLNIVIKSILFTVLGGVGILVSYLLYNKTEERK